MSRDTVNWKTQRKRIMAKKQATNDITAQRKEWVARLLLRGLLMRRIAVALPDQGVVNAKGEAFTKSTIARDLQFLRGRWLPELAKAIEVAKHTDAV